MLAEAAVIDLVDLALEDAMTLKVLSAGVSVNTLQLAGAMLFVTEYIVGIANFLNAAVAVVSGQRVFVYHDAGYVDSRCS